jgi:hypothetical protein
MSSDPVVFHDHLCAVHRRFIHWIVDQVVGLEEIEIEPGVHDCVGRFVAAEVRGIVIAATMKRRIVKTRSRILSVCSFFDWSRASIQMQGELFRNLLMLNCSRPIAVDHFCLWLSSGRTGRFRDA